MNDTTLRTGQYPFVWGLFTGTFVGAALATWLAPRASKKYRQASIRVGDVIHDFTERGQGVRDDIAGAVARGAHEVAHVAGEVERAATATRRPRAVQATPSM